MKINLLPPFYTRQCTADIAANFLIALKHAKIIDDGAIQHAKTCKIPPEWLMPFRDPV